jgi:hypothetical protein
VKPMTVSAKIAPDVQPLQHHHQAAIVALFRVINRYVGNLPPMPGVFPDYPAPVIRPRRRCVEYHEVPASVLILGDDDEPALRQRGRLELRPTETAPLPAPF